MNQLTKQPDMFMNEYCDTIANTLKETAEVLDYQKIDAFILKLQAAERVFIFATSTSLMMAEIIQSNLLSFKKIVYVSFNQNNRKTILKILNLPI